VPHHWKVLKFAGEKPQAEKDIILIGVRQHWRALERAGDNLVSDRKFMLAAVLANPDCFQFAAPRYKNDAEFWQNVITECPDGWKMALDKWGPKELRGNRQLIMFCLKVTWEAIKLATPTLCADEEIVREAVKHCWEAVDYALVMPLDVMKNAVKQDWRAIRRMVQDDPSEADVITMIRVNPKVIRHAALAKQNFAVGAACGLSGMCLEFASPKLQGDPEITMTAVAQNWRALKFCSPEQKNCRELVEKAFKQSGLALQFASKELRGDHLCVIESMKHNMDAFNFATPILQVDSDFWKACMRRLPASQKLWLKQKDAGKFEPRHLQTLGLPPMPT